MSNLIERIKRIFKQRVNFPELISEEPSKEFFCPVCKHATGMLPLHPMYFAKMLEYRCIHNIFLLETINLEHYKCGSCGASDRDRLYALYLQSHLAKKETVKFLDIAPSSQLSNFIKQFSNVNYRSTDLCMEGVDDLQDITEMNLYQEGQFDFFICSHVLEHVTDDRKAMAELYRVLKKGGKGIAMVPINLGVEKTLEDPTITDEASRWKFFGQDDHVRMYAKADFIQRLVEAGFSVELLDKDCFGEDTFKRAAIFSESVLYIVSK